MHYKYGIPTNVYIAINMDLGGVLWLNNVAWRSKLYLKHIHGECLYLYYDSPINVNRKWIINLLVQNVYQYDFVFI